MTKVVDQHCDSCGKCVVNIKKKYKGKKFCATCYARVFSKRLCLGCGEFARLPKNDDEARCNECIKKQPCIRCNLSNKPIGKLTEYGPVCNSCSVYFRAIEPCERCGKPSQKLTRVTRFNDDLRVCPKCASRDYETCPSCHKYRLLELTLNGLKVCKKCQGQSEKQCLNCEGMIAAGCGDLCDSCYWHKNLWFKVKQNLNLFESNCLKNIYVQYIEWLENKVGANKAALYISKHTHFFVQTESLWNDSVPTAHQLLATLRSSGLRKFELVVLWLHEHFGIQISVDKKNNVSEIDQLEKLIASLPQPSLGFETISAYKNQLENKINRGKTSMRSARLAIKPAVALMMHMNQGCTQLPSLKDVKSYLAEYSGQAAALTGYINFLNENYDTSIDYLALKKSGFLNQKRKENLERTIVKLANINDPKNVLEWVRAGLQYFHQLSYAKTLKVRFEMIINDEIGYTVVYEEKLYWLPKK
ncbi:transposase [Acinetobacter baumannii]